MLENNEIKNIMFHFNENRPYNKCVTMFGNYSLHILEHQMSSAPLNILWLHKGLSLSDQLLQLQPRPMPNDHQKLKQTTKREGGDAIATLHCIESPTPSVTRCFQVNAYCLVIQLYWYIDTYTFSPTYIRKYSKYSLL